MRDPEYDRFGPWAVEISDADPPPPLFLPYLTRNESPLLAIKIPRSIERHKARAGMNLYDYMVSLYADDLMILQRVDDGVHRQTLLYRDIQALRYAEELLKGTVHLFLKSQTHKLPFNTVSKALMQRMVVLIRGRYVEEISVAPPVYDLVAYHEDLSFYFTNLLAAEQACKPDLRLMATQADTPVGTHESGVRKLFFGAFGKTLLESMHLYDGGELKIIDRGQDFRYAWQSAYGRRETYVPLRNICCVDWMPDPKNAAIVNLNLETAGGRLTFALLRDNPDIQAYANSLSTMLENQY